MNEIKYKRSTLIMLLLMAVSMTGYAQNVQNVEYFTYEDNAKTIIDGLTQAGMDAEELTIPATVITVRSRSFSGARTGSNPLTSLTIDGGNPAFESSLFGENTSTLTVIDMGSGMTVANMEALLTSLGTTSNLETVEIDDYSGEYSWERTPFTGYDWTNLSSITLPAALLADQSFGSAQVYGRFSINKEVITYCGRANYVNNDANTQFYVATGKVNQYIQIKSVSYIKAGAGLLIHRTESTSGTLYLERVDNGSSQDDSSYENNWLVGVTQRSLVYKTEGDYTNLVLSNGAFHPIKENGYIGANRAYLHISSSLLSDPNQARLDIVFPEDESAGISEEFIDERSMENEQFASAQVYDLQGRRVEKPGKGLYIVNGKKVIMR